MKATLSFFLANLALATACKSIMKDAGASDTFAAMVAHGIHGMTLDDLKKFDPLATEDNYVPTVNRDLRAEQAIIPYAKDMKPADRALRTEGMQVLDMVIMHMNDKHWDITGFNALERVAHIFHMRELWLYTKDQFDQIGKTIPAPNENACLCMMDVENNGVMKMMRFVTMALREPSLVYGDPAFSSRSNKTAPSKTVMILIDYLQHDDMKTVSNSGTEDLFLRAFKDSMPRLKDAETWEFWKGKNYTKDDHKNLALFLHCAIAKAHKA